MLATVLTELPQLQINKSGMTKQVYQKNNQNWNKDYREEETETKEITKQMYNEIDRELRSTASIHLLLLHSYRLWRVIVCDQETSKTRRLKPATGLWKYNHNGL
jgi:hypothetical protein